MDVRAAIDELRKRHRSISVSRLISNTELLFARDPERLLSLRRDSLARSLADELVTAIPWVERRSHEHDALHITGTIVVLTPGEAEALIRDAYLRGHGDGYRDRDRVGPKSLDTGSTPP